MISNKARLLMLAALAVSVFPVFAQTDNAPAASSTTGSAAKADNTKVNKRDRADTKTAFDQPNDKADIKVAAAVRKAIVGDDSLSTSAHNVKLIAAKGVVTLRGPVKSADEKSKVESLAKNVDGVTSVDNQLDIKQ